MQCKASEKPIILLVGSGLETFNWLRSSFAQDYQVIRANSESAALEICHQGGEVAVVITDGELPEIKGTDLLSLIANQYPNIIPILITSQSRSEDCGEIIKTDRVFNYLTKPVNLDELQLIISQGLNTYNLLKKQTEQLHRCLRQQALLNGINNAIHNFQIENLDGLPLPSVLQKIVNIIGQLIDADICLLRPLPVMGVNECFIYYNSDLYCSNSVQISPQVLALTVWETRQIEIIRNVATDELFTLNPPEMHQRVQAYRQAEISSSVIVPIILQGDLLAVLGLHRCRNHQGWDDDTINLMMMVADQATVAISQAQAYEKVQALAQRASLLNNITNAIRSSLDPQQIFTQITQQLGQALTVEGCALSLWTKKDEFVQCVGLYDFQESQIIDQEQQANRVRKLPQSYVPIAKNPVLQQLLDTSKPVVLEDLQLDAQMNKFDLPLRSPARALLIVPLIVDGEIIGSISLRQTNYARQWTDAEIELAQAVASQAAIAVQQSQLYDQVKRLNTYLTESVLTRFLPPAIVNKAAAGELILNLTPELRLVTILFSDIVGFTPLSSRLGPRRVADLLNEYLEAMTQIIFDNGGTVDKFIGDAVLALFGAPEELSAQEQVHRAIAVARGMYRYLEQLNQSWLNRGLIGGYGPSPVQFRCGIHQGKAVVGMFGGGRRSDYTAIGPAVNVAARLQKAAEPNSILVSEEVANYLQIPEIKSVKCCLKLKGIHEEVKAFSLMLSE